MRNRKRSNKKTDEAELLREDWLDAPAVILPAYEPTGLQVEISGRTLCNHTALIGASGSGKTSVLRWYLKSIVGSPGQNSERRPGLFIFDLNADSTPNLVRHWAALAGRSADIRLLTPDTGHLNLFEGIRDLRDLPLAVAQLSYGDWSKTGSENAYWINTVLVLLDAILTICLTVEGKLQTPTIIEAITNHLIYNVRETPTGLLADFRSLCQRAGTYLDRHALTKLTTTQATLAMFSNLDTRTRSILTSIIMDVIAPLVSLEAIKFLDENRGAAFSPEEIVDGRIIIFSISAATAPEAASLLGKIIKARLFSALQKREQDLNQRLCVIVSDEYHYLATGGNDRSSDIKAFATLRSRNTALVVASQSLEHLSLSMGSRDFAALQPNIGNFIFFRSTEPRTNALATAVMGTRRVERSGDIDLGDLEVSTPLQTSLEYICPPAALTQLEPLQSYVALSTGYRSPGMVWLAGNFEEFPPALAARQPQGGNANEEGLARLRAAVLGCPTDQPEPELEDDQADYDWTDDPVDDPNLVCKFYDMPTWINLLRHPRFSRTSVDNLCGSLRELGQTPSGLNSIPVAWWDCIIRYIKAQPLPPDSIVGLSQADGLLQILLQGQRVKGDPQKWIARLEHSVYPSRARPLTWRDYRLKVALERMGSWPPSGWGSGFQF
jgi:hypothetical protein